MRKNAPPPLACRRVVLQRSEDARLQCSVRIMEWMKPKVIALGLLGSTIQHGHPSDGPLRLAGLVCPDRLSSEERKFGILLAPDRWESKGSKENDVSRFMRRNGTEMVGHERCVESVQLHRTHEIFFLVLTFKA